MNTELSSVNLLRSVPFFAGLSTESLRTLARHARRRHFPPDEALFHEGDPGQVLYVIGSGRVDIRTSTEAGGIVHLATRGPGEPFGELALIDGKPRMADAVTAETSDLLLLDREDFLECIRESPEIALGVMGCLADRLREAAQQQESRQGLDVLGRVAELLLDLAGASTATERASDAQPGLRISQQAIADRIGTTRESVNRALSRLRATGAIRLDRRAVVVSDPARLSQLCKR